MTKKERFENFVSGMKIFYPIDFTWDSSSKSYFSLKTQNLFDFYNDIFKFEVGYKIVLLRSGALIILSLGIFVLSIASTMHINDFVTIVFKSQNKEILALIFSILFLASVLLLFTLLIKKMFDI